MNADEIRAEVIKRLARVTYEEKQSEWDDIEFRPRWDDLTDDERAPWLAQEEPYADALGDMLPTQSEWYVVYDDPDHGKVLSTFCQRREDAEHQIRCNEDEFHDGRSSLARRFLTAWLEVTE